MAASGLEGQVILGNPEIVVRRPPREVLSGQSPPSRSQSNMIWAPTGMVEEITMARKKPEEVRVKKIVDPSDPPRLVVEPPGPEPGLQPAPTEERLSGANTHLAKALEIATAECARLAEKGTTLAAELEEAKERLLKDKARVRELEGVLKQIESLATGPERSS